MVHKKSEYRLQFHMLSKDLQKQIWQENIRFRNLHRSVNQAHHYWDFQLTEDNCECCSDVDDKAKDSPSFGKNGQVIPMNFEDFNGEKPTGVTDDKEIHKDIGIQTYDEWDHVKGNCDGIMKTNGSFAPGSSGTTKQPNVSDGLLTDKSSQTIKDDSKIVKHVRSPGTVTSTKNDHSSRRPRSACLQREFDTKVLPDSIRQLKTRSPSPRFSVLSRTSRKFHLEHQKKKSPFSTYGWNDSQKIIGCKKTYNICAPEPEVYYSAIQAMKNRRNEIDEFLALENQCNLQANFKSVINHSSIWMSEYKDKFSKQMDSTQDLPKSVRKTLAWRVS